MNHLGRWCRGAVLVVFPFFLLLSEAPGQEASEKRARVEFEQEAPRFELESLDGTRASLEGLRGESPLVLIFFRGTW